MSESSIPIPEFGEIPLHPFHFSFADGVKIDTFVFPYSSTPTPNIFGESHQVITQSQFEEFKTQFHGIYSKIHYPERHPSNKLHEIIYNSPQSLTPVIITERTSGALQVRMPYKQLTGLLCTYVDGQPETILVTQVFPNSREYDATFGRSTHMHDLNPTQQSLYAETHMRISFASDPNQIQFFDSELAYHTNQDSQTMFDFAFEKSYRPTRQENHIISKQNNTLIIRTTRSNFTQQISTIPWDISLLPLELSRVDNVWWSLPWDNFTLQIQKKRPLE